MGVTVSPAYQQVTIAPGETAHPVKFRITNNEPLTQTLDLSVQDFNTLGESGGLFFVGTNPTELQKKYGLAKWFSLPFKTLTLQPGQSQVVSGDVLNLPDLSPGGHYGALLLAERSGGTAAQANKITLHPIASSLMFVTKTGGDTHSLKLADVSSHHGLFDLPSSVTLRFQNDGNTHVIPRGLVTITDSSGKVFSKGIINEDSNIVLPQSFRQIYVPLDKVGGAHAIGRYQLRVDFRFDGFNQYREYRSSFIYIPKFIAAIIVIVLVAAFFILIRRRPLPRKTRR